MKSSIRIITTLLVVPLLMATELIQFSVADLGAAPSFAQIMSQQASVAKPAPITSIAPPKSYLNAANILPSPAGSTSGQRSSTSSGMTWAQKASNIKLSAQANPSNQLRPVMKKTTSPTTKYAEIKNSALTNRQVTANDYGQCGQNYDFDYVKLAISWTPGYCRTSDRVCVQDRVNGFNLHGLWPQRTCSGQNSCPEPQFCCFHKNLDRTAISSDTWKYINQVWRSVHNSDPNYGNWQHISHQWQKHGTCARDLKNFTGPKQYIESTIAAYAKLDLVNAFGRAGILPNNEKPISGQRIVSAMKSLTGGRAVQITCDMPKRGKKSKFPIFKEISFCMDKNKNYIDCPGSHPDCLNNVMFIEK